MADGMEVQSDVALSDECGSLSDEDSNGGPVVVSGNQKFPGAVSAILEGLYQKGMTGWGKMHSADFRMAVTSTGLTSSQVKVKSISRVAVLNNRHYIPTSPVNNG